MPTGTVRLSGLQRGVLAWLHREGRAIDPASPTARFGVRWQPSKGRASWSRSEAAVMSRALARLEARGLVVPNRSTISGVVRYVRLTDAGRELAAALDREGW